MCVEIEVYTSYLYFLLSFAVNLNLLENTKSINIYKTKKQWKRESKIYPQKTAGPSNVIGKFFYQFLKEDTSSV